MRKKPRQTDAASPQEQGEVIASATKPLIQPIAPSEVPSSATKAREYLQRRMIFQHIGEKAHAVRQRQEE